ncbi:transposase (plasmid) [Lactococcus lactis]
MDTLDELTENIPEGIKPIIHSDQGWHYQLNYYTDKLSEKNLYKACLVRETVLIMRQLKASFICLKQNVLMDFHSVKILENSRKSQRITSIGLTIDEYHRKQKA